MNTQNDQNTAGDPQSCYVPIQPAQTCPCCGYCPHCGRRNATPYVPYVPNTAPWPNPYTQPWITWTVSTTGSNTIQ